MNVLHIFYTQQHSSVQNDNINNWLNVRRNSQRGRRENTFLFKRNGNGRNGKKIACVHRDDLMMAGRTEGEMSQNKTGSSYLSQEERRDQRLGWQPQP